MAEGDDFDESVPPHVALALRRYDLLRSLVPIAYIAVLWFPIKAIQPIAEVLAGRDTNVTITVSITIAITIALGAGVAALLRRSSAQREELQRQRRRITELEKEIDVMRKLNPGR